MSTLKKGDVVTRMLAGTIPMQLRITDITDNKIVCGAWVFDKETGHEIDDDISCLVSFIKLND